jgi:hypothetical protein
MLFHVYADPKPEGYYDPTTEPFGIYRQILDADWLLWILLPLLLIIIVALLMLAWRVHEIPAHKADHKKMRQAELVSALTLLGLLEHWVWAVALFIAYMDWQATEDWLVRILGRSRQPDSGNATVQPAPTFATVPTTATGAASAAPVASTVKPAPVEPSLKAVPASSSQQEPKA